MLCSGDVPAVKITSVGWSESLYLAPNSQVPCNMSEGGVKSFKKNSVILPQCGMEHVLLIACFRYTGVHLHVCVRADNIWGMEAPSGQWSLSPFLKAKYRKWTLGSEPDSAESAWATIAASEVLASFCMRFVCSRTSPGKLFKDSAALPSSSLWDQRVIS